MELLIRSFAGEGPLGSYVFCSDRLPWPVQILHKVVFTTADVMDYEVRRKTMADCMKVWLLLVHVIEC